MQSGAGQSNGTGGSGRPMLPALLVESGSDEESSSDSELRRDGAAGGDVDERSELPSGRSPNVHVSTPRPVSHSHKSG